MKKMPEKHGHVRRLFVTGITVGAPVAVTLWLVWAVIEAIDRRVIPLIPAGILPTDSILRVVPGAGVVIFFLTAVILGIITRGFIGRAMVRLGDRFFDRLPVVRTIYSSVKQIVDTVFGQDNPKFETACLVEYPRRGTWSLGFISTKARGEITAKLPGTDQNDPLLSLFVPTTPNPTSGFLLFARQSEVIILDMGVDDAAKLVISAGLVYPNPESPKGSVISASDPRLN